LTRSQVDGAQLWICNDAGIHRATFSLANQHTAPMLKIEQLQSITCFELACCGLDICRATGTHVAVGDLTGKIAVWAISQATPNKVLSTESMIRSLTWWHANDIQYGTLGGEIWTWPVNSDLPPRLVTSVTGGVTCLAWDPIGQSVLAASTTDGEVFLLSRDAQGEWHQIGQLAARAQAPYVSSREIWSLAWSPCGTYLATGGEDRITHVHRVLRETAVSIESRPCHVLEDKTAAVTCLDWQYTRPGESTLAVSSDDCTVHCWHLTERDTLLHDTLRTDTRQLMITYCALSSTLNQGNAHVTPRLFCGTMGGAVWSCQLPHSATTTVHARTHFGSIEGLRAMTLPNLGITRVVTCASDLTVQVTDFPLDTRC
jgi:WD40 repeat protein